jgi:taurine dioxygenase
MEVKNIHSLGYGLQIKSFPSATATLEEIQALKSAVYQHKIVLLKNQNLTPREFVNFGRKFGEVQEYYEKMYHHPEEKEIFVSSNIKENGTIHGVPKTGSFWHADYAFMEKPFALTITYPQVVPKINRGTYFIDMAEVYESLSDGIKKQIKNASCQHSVRKYFKIRPHDVYRPIGEILKEIDEVTPTVTHPTVLTHPITQQKVLYINEGFTLSLDGIGEEGPSILHQLLALSGQLDKSYSHPQIKLLEIELGDIIIWDNRRLVHHAKHSAISEPSKTFRLTVYDEHPFSASHQETYHEVLKENTFEKIV